MRALVLAALALSSLANPVLAQAVPEGIAPEGESPPGCEQTVDGNFTIGIAVPIASRSKRESAAEAAGTALECTLTDGVLRDPYGRTGAIVANFQFQFDGPPQAGTIYTGGFSVCQNGSLALGSSAVWYRCMSGEFGNLYDRSIGDQCHQVRIVAALVDPPTLSSSPAAPSRTPVNSSSGSASPSDSASPSATGSVDSAGSTPTLSKSRSDSTSAATSSTPAATTGNLGVPEAPPGSTGAAVPTRAPRRETFGAVVGILGAALIL